MIGLPGVLPLRKINTEPEPGGRETPLVSALLQRVAVETIPMFLDQMLLGSLVARDFDPLVSECGDMVNIPISPIMWSNCVNAKEDRRPSLGNARIVLAHHMEASFHVPDIRKALADPRLLKSYMLPSVLALVESIESALIAVASQFTANGPVIMDRENIESAIDAVETSLFYAKVPLSMPKHLIVDPVTYAAIRRHPRFLEYTAPYGYGHAAGKIKDLYVYRTNLMRADTSKLAIANDALVLVTRRLPAPIPDCGWESRYAETGNFGFRVLVETPRQWKDWLFNIDVLFGVGVLRNPFGVELKEA
jgi:hypothetical protein